MAEQIQMPVTGFEQDVEEQQPQAAAPTPVPEPTVSPEISKNIQASMESMTKVPEYQPSPAVHAKGLHYDSSTHKYVEIGPNIPVVGIPHEADANVVSDAVYSAYNKIFPFQSADQKDLLTDMGKVVEARERIVRKGAEVGGKAAIGLVMGQGPVSGFEPIEDLPAITPEEFKKSNPYAYGIAKGLGKTAGGFLADPVNIPFMFSGGASVFLKSAIAYGFAGLQSKGNLDEANNLLANWNKLSPDERAEGVTKLGLGTIMAVMATAHATETGIDAITGTKVGESSHVATEIGGKEYDIPKEHIGWMPQAIHEATEGKYTEANEPLYHGPYTEELAPKAEETKPLPKEISISPVVEEPETKLQVKTTPEPESFLHDSSDLDEFDSKLTSRLIKLHDQIKNDPIRDMALAGTDTGKASAWRYTYDAVKNKLLPAIEDASTSLGKGKQRSISIDIDSANKRLANSMDQYQKGNVGTAYMNADAALSQLHDSIQTIRNATRGTKLSVAEDWQKIMESTEPDIEHVQTAFPNSDVTRLTDSSWKVKTPAGHDIVVVKTPEVSTEGSGITLKNNQYAAGSWRQVDTGGIMYLAKTAGQPTVHHEAFHAAWDLAMDDADREAMTKRYGSEEAAAEAYGEWNPQAEPHTLFEKIQNYFRRLYNSVVSPDKNLFEDVRSGKVWEEASDRRASIGEDSSINFSINTKPKWEKAYSAAAELAGVDPKMVEKAKSAVNEVSSVMESMRELLPEETEGSAIKQNMDYLKTVDLNTICPRTNRFQGTISGVEEKLGRILSGDERLEVAKNMQQHGYTSPCAYCYVEQGRNRMVNRVKRLAAEAGVPEKALFDDAYRAELSKDPKLAKKIADVQTEAKKPMMVNVAKPYVPYTAQILRWDQKLVDDINGRAGLRFFSSTDFQPEHMLDLMQVISDANARGLKAHNYTKEPDFVRVFGNTGIKVNMSIHAKGGVEGAPIVESPESMPWKDAQQLRKQFPNAGTMLMVTNDAQLEYALRQPWVDMAIPFHGDRPAMYKEGPERWTDYSGEQHETDIKTGKSAPRIDPKDHLNDVNTYLKLCQKQGVLPRFARFIYDNNDLVIKHGANGVSSVTLKPGVKKPTIIKENAEGYMKLIRDIARTDSPHEVVQPNFDTKAATKVLKKWEKGGGTRKDAIPEVVNDMAGQLTGGKKPDLIQIAPAKSVPKPEPRLEIPADILSAYPKLGGKTPEAPPIPQTGQMPAVKTLDGQIFTDPNADTHIGIVRHAGIPADQVEGGGWLNEGVYESTHSDAVGYGERARAKLRLLKAKQKSSK